MTSSHLPRSSRAPRSSIFCCWDCFFPHGEVPILLLVMTVAACVCSLISFIPDFVCIEFEIKVPRPSLPSGDLSDVGIDPGDLLPDLEEILGDARSPKTYTTLPHACFDLRMVDRDYWTRPKEFRGWASALRAAAVFSVIAASLGIAAIVILSVSPCIPLAIKRIRLLVILLGVAACSQLLTMAACATDVCGFDWEMTSGSVTCENGRAFLMGGGVTAVMGFFVYLGACIVALRYYKEISGNQDSDVTNDSSSKEEKESLVHRHHSSPQRSKKLLKKHDLEQSPRRKMAPPLEDEEEEEFEDLEV